MEHNANTVNESQKTIFISFASNIVNVNDITQIANSGVRFIGLIIWLLLVEKPGLEPGRFYSIRYNWHFNQTIFFVITPSQVEVKADAIFSISFIVNLFNSLRLPIPPILLIKKVHYLRRPYTCTTQTQNKTRQTKICLWNYFSILIFTPLIIPKCLKYTSSG